MCKKSAAILPDRKKWLAFLKVFMALNFIWVFLSLLILEIQTGFLKIEEISLCNTLLFILIRSGGQLVTFVFVILGIIITKKVRLFTGDTKYEREELVKDYKRALKRMW